MNAINQRTVKPAEGMFGGYLPWPWRCSYHMPRTRSLGPVAWQLLSLGGVGRRARRVTAFYLKIRVHFTHAGALTSASKRFGIPPRLVREYLAGTLREVSRTSSGPTALRARRLAAVAAGRKVA